MIAAWKIIRELRRIKTQLVGTIWRPVELARLHLLGRSSAMQTSPDSIDVKGAKDVAIFVVFQKNGLCETVFDTLDHLIEKGFAVVVVSNAPLSADDRKRLIKYAVHVLERPNFGYDFGAYQHVIRALPNMGADLRSLLLINDSIWFPTVANPQLIDDMRAHPADVLAAQIFNETGNARRQEKACCFVLGSYLMLFKQSALANDGFRSFWQKYRMSSNKEVTLRQGERGLSKAMQVANLKCAGIYDQARFNQKLESLDECQLYRCLNDLILLDEKSQHVRSDLLMQDRSVAWSATVRAFISEVVRRKNYIGAAPVFSIDSLGVEVIKKNDEMLYRLARQELTKWASKNQTTCTNRRVFAALAAYSARDRVPDSLQSRGTH